MEIARRHIEKDTYPQVLPANARQEIRDAINPIYEELTGRHLGEGSSAEGRSADAPSHFDKLKFRSRHIEQVLRREESGGARARDFSGTMLLRIDRLLADRRSNSSSVPLVRLSRSQLMRSPAFLRDTLGIGSSDTGALSKEDAVPRSQLPFYDRQRDGEGPVDVVILDLSLLAAEVLENVTALVGRLVLEFVQRLGEHGGEQARGSLR